MMAEKQTACREEAEISTDFPYEFTMDPQTQIVWTRRVPSPEPVTYRQFQAVRATTGDTVRMPCRLSPNVRAAAREIRWFKGADCIKVFQGSSPEENETAEETPSKERDVSLILNNVKVTDSGQYKCEMLGERKEEILFTHMHVSEFKLVFESREIGRPSYVQTLGYRDRKRRRPDFDLHAFFGDATLPCYLSPETSAVSMEIRWFKGTDCISLYQNGQMREGRGYEGRVSMFTHELQKGNVSLKLRDVQESDRGQYRCVVTHGKHKVKTDEIHFTVSACYSQVHSGILPWHPKALYIGNAYCLKTANMKNTHIATRTRQEQHRGLNILAQ